MMSNEANQRLKRDTQHVPLVVYYESIKRELKMPLASAEARKKNVFFLVLFCLFFRGGEILDRGTGLAWALLWIVFHVLVSA